MSIFAISDLHLSFRPDGTVYKPMDVFGGTWQDYPAKLKENWQALVRPEDTVLMPGDLSWAMTLEEMDGDLDYLKSLPGKKIIIKGNHDYWWQSLTKVRDFLAPHLMPLQHSAIQVEEYAVCGTRGWIMPGHSDYKESEDGKIYQRELLRLEMALKEAKKIGLPIIAMLHYPPLMKDGEDTGFSRMLEEYGVEYCLYGHIHGVSPATFTGEKNGVIYHNCSCDRLDFRPLQIAGNKQETENFD